MPRLRLNDARLGLVLFAATLVCVPVGCGNEGETTNDRDDDGSGGAAPGSGGSIDGSAGGSASGGEPSGVGGMEELGGFGGGGSGGAGTGGNGSGGMGTGGEPVGPASTFLPDGDAIEICSDVGLYTPSTIHFTPNLLVQGGTIAITCSSSTLTWPFVIKFLDDEGVELNRRTLRQSFAQYYSEASLVYEGGQFHVLKSYRCDDNGSWAVGHGWTCLEHNRFGSTGEFLNGPAPFGETGLNEYPGLASNGTILGAAWASYDEVRFRQINLDGTLVGDLPSDNVLVDSPGDSAGYWNSRSRMTWDGTHWGLFFSIENELLYYRLTEAGAVVTGPLNLGSVAAGPFGGDLTVITTGGSHYIYYGFGMETFLKKVSFSGVVEDSVTTSAERQPYPSMVLADDRFYVGYSDPDTGAPAIEVYDLDLDEIPDAGGIVDPDATAYSVRLAYDPSSGQFVMAYNLANDNNARLQLLTRVP